MDAGRTLLAAYLKARRRFARTTGRGGAREWNRRLLARFVDMIAAAEDLRDHLAALDEVESTRHLVTLDFEGEVRVVRTARVRPVAARIEVADAA